MLKDAAEMAGMSGHTLRKHVLEGTPGLQPSKTAMFGKIRVYLFTPTDIDRMKKTLAARTQVIDYSGAGRPRKYNAEQRKARARLYGRRTYWGRAKKKAIFLEDRDREVEAKNKIEEITRELKEM